jgi:signal transduction histidine kinase
MADNVPSGRFSADRPWGGAVVAEDLSPSSDLRAAAAARLEAAEAEILRAYQQVLVEMGSRLVGDSLSLQQELTNAELILADVLRSLAAGRVMVDEGDPLLSWDIGATRAVHGTHPDESLRDAVAFFGIVMKAVASETDAVDVDCLLLVSLALTESISVRIAKATVSYAGFLLNRIHEANIAERRRIARELHDRVGPGLSGAHSQLELYQMYRDADRPRADKRADAAAQAVSEGLSNLRAVTSILHLQEPLKSLEMALDDFLALTSRGEVSVRLRVNGDEIWAPPAVRDESFLILREAIRNALAHGNPKVVFVGVDIAPHALRAWVEDDGDGFDLGKDGSSGLGLSSMRERAHLMGGNITVMSRRGRGTHVELLIPLLGMHDDRT